MELSTAFEHGFHEHVAATVLNLARTFIQSMSRVYTRNFFIHPSDFKIKFNFQKCCIIS